MHLGLEKLRLVVIHKKVGLALTKDRKGHGAWSIAYKTKSKAKILK
jgi:hypothetical protein